MQQKHRPYSYTTEYFTEQPCYNRTDSQLYSRIFYNKAMLQSIQSTSKYFIVQSFTNTKTLQSTPKCFTVKPFYKSADPIIKHKTIIKLYLENRRHICAENLDKISIFVEILTRKIFPKNDRLTWRWVIKIRNLHIKN